MLDKDDLNYCPCGEYLAPGKERCDDPKYGCQQRRPGFYCHGSSHWWQPPARNHCVQGSDLPAHCPKCNAERWDLFRDRIEWRSRDREYWKRTFIAARATYQANIDRYWNIVDTDTYIKLTRYNERRPKQVRGDNPVADYGPRVGSWINVQLEALRHDVNDNCIDNYRFADMSNRKDMRRFKKAQARGCCGSTNRVVILGLHRFIVGLNYGH